MSLTGAPLLCLLGLVALTTLALTAALPRLRWRLVAVVCCLLSTGLTWAAAENDQFGYDQSWSALLGTQHQPDLVAGIHVHLAPSAPPASALGWPAVAQARRQAGRGTLLAVDFDGRRSRLDRSGYVYLPPEYFSPAYADVRFPVIELISGSPGGPKNWLKQLNVVQVADYLLARHLMPPMVLVIPAPNGHLVQSQECVDAVRGPQDDTYLTNDVRADVVAGLRVSSDRRAWGIAGYSTGGFCAVNLLTRHSADYSAAASMDGYFHALDDHYTGDLYRGNKALRLANSPDWVWAHHPPADPVAIQLLAGGDDVSATEASVELHDQLATSAAVVRGGDTVELTIHRHAGHTFIAWRADLPTVLEWMGRHLQVPASAPSPAAAAPASSSADQQPAGPRRRGGMRPR